MHFNSANISRFSITSSWRQRSYIESSNYTNMISNNISIIDYIHFAFEREVFEKTGCIISRVKPNFFNSYVSIDIEYYNGMIEFFFSKKRKYMSNSYRYSYINYNKFFSYAKNNNFVNKNRHNRIIRMKDLRYQFSNKISVNNFYNHFYEFYFRYRFRQKRLRKNIIFEKSQIRAYNIFQSYLNYFKTIIKRDVNRLFFRFKPSMIKVFFKPVLSQKINSQIISRYIRVRLEQFDSFNEIVFPMVRYVFGFTRLSGLKIRCSGRLTRQQRASVREHVVGAASFSTVSYLLDFSYDVAVLKYGASSIRVWISRGFFRNNTILYSSNISKFFKDKFKDKFKNEAR